MIKQDIRERNSRLRQRLRRTGEFLLRLFYPVHCPVCDRILSVGSCGVCDDCEQKLPWAIQPLCMKCGKVLEDDRREYCRDCMKYPHQYDRGIAAFEYTGSMRHSVQQMKFHNRRDHLDFYADSMVKQGQRWIAAWRPDVIIPVPMHWKKKNQRGFNQSELLAEKIGRQTGIPVRRDIVKKNRNTADQKTLSQAERRKNLEAAFCLKKDPEGIRTVLLVDDVYTTGSTVDALASLLKKNGVKYVYFLVLCIGKG